MKNMKLASRSDSISPLEVSLTYRNNPRVMKIIKDSYGNLNERYNSVQVQGTTPSFKSCHYMISGNNFVPIPMDISSTQSQIGEKFHKTTSNHLMSPTVKHTPRSMLPRATNNNLGTLMPLPVPTQNRENKYVNIFQSSAPSSWISRNNESDIKKEEFEANKNERKNYQAKSIFCTGTIERLLRWNRNLENVFCMYETVASIVALQEGRIKNQKIMLLRDKKGPILQVQYYTSTHIDINDFYIGQYLRCVGRMIGFNVLSAESIREATESEISTLARLSYVCDYSVTHNLSTA